MKKNLIKMITVIGLIILVLLRSGAVDYYDYYGSSYNYYFNRQHSYFLRDYANVSCVDYGGGFEDTDFLATTNGIGTDVYNLTKVLSVSVTFHDVDGAITEGNDSFHVPYNRRSFESANVYGSDYVNNEYGLDSFTSIHTVYVYDSRYICEETGEPITFEYHTMYIDSTGYYR